MKYYILTKLVYLLQLSLVMSFAMNTRLRGKGVTVNCVHPGNMVYSDLSRNWWLWKALFFVLRPFTKTLVGTIFC